MAPTLKQAFTPSVEVLWFGELSDQFRQEAAAILGRALSDEAWGKLNSVTRSYSFSLNREHVAASLVDQKKVVAKLAAASEAFMSAIEAADTQEMGLVVTNRLAEKWDDLFDHGEEFDRHERAIRDDIAHILIAHGHSAAEEQAAQCISDWKARGMLVRPSMPADFITLLGEFNMAIRLFNSGLANGTEYYDERGSGWVHFIGMLTEWAADFGYPKWVSNSDQFDGAGPFTYLVKAINDQIPEMLEADGSRNVKQMRRPTISDASLAKSITEARKEYEAGRPT